MKEYSSAEANAILNAHTDLNDMLHYLRGLKNLAAKNPHDNDKLLDEKIGALWTTIEDLEREFPFWESE